MDENMFINLDAIKEDQASSPKLSKTWEYTEKVNLHSIHHTLTVQDDKLTHITEMKEAGQAMKKRKDIKLDNVRAVHTYYGMSRNILAIVLCALLAVFSFIGAIAVFAGSSENSASEKSPYGGSYGNDKYGSYGGYYNDYYDDYYDDYYGDHEEEEEKSDVDVGAIIGGIVLLVVAGGFGFLTYLFLKPRPSFVLEIEMYIPENKKIEKQFAYGNASITLGRITGNRYKLVMDPEMGNDIVDTLGVYLISE